MAYSEEIQSILKGKNIKIGDRIAFGEYEGLLMPSPEITASPEHLIIKLDNGYNIGIKYEKNLRIQKIKHIEKPMIKLHIKEKKEKPPISLLAVGGTISSKVDYKTGAVFPVLTAEELISNVPELVDIVRFKQMKTIMEVLSEDLDYTNWIKIAEECVKQLNSESNGIIITHGTDTMHYTSAALSFFLRDLKKPIVLTGSQRSTDRGSADSAMNLICSAHAAISNIAEVGICMHAEPDDSYCYFLRGTKVRKMHTSMRNTFRPINDYPLASIYPTGRIEVINKNYRKRSEGKTKLDKKFEPRIALLKSYPGSEPKIIDFLLKENYKGIVIEGTGLGHVPTNAKKSWIPHIENAVNSGIAIAIAPQTLYGKVNTNVYRNLRILFYETGAIPCKDMLPETAYVKLGWVLGHTKDMKKIKEMMLKNYAGEINPRLEPDMFLY